MALTTDEAAELNSLRSARTLRLSGQMPERVMFNGRLTQWAQMSDRDKTDADDRLAELEAKEQGAAARRRGGAIRIRL